MINSVNRIILFFAISVFLFSCQTEEEDTRFKNYFISYQKLYAMHFPEGQYQLADTNFVKNLTDNQVFEDVQFCNEQLDKLARFNLKKLSEENRALWKQAFNDMKGRLAEIETWSNNPVEEESGEQ